MKTLVTSILLFGISLYNAQNSQDTITIKRALIIKEGNSYYIYDKNESCLFTKLNTVSQKEELLPVCFGDLYNAYVDSDKKILQKITLKEAKKNIDKPQKFEELITLTDF